MDEIIPKNIDSKSLDLGKLLRWEKENVREADLSKREKESWRESGFPFRLFYVSAYSLHIERWLSVFDKKDFLFVKIDNFVRERKKVKKRVGDFLDIQKRKFKKLKKENRNRTTGYTPSLARAMRILKNSLNYFVPLPIQEKLLKIEDTILRKRPVSYEFDKDTYVELNRIFDEEIKRTSELTGLDLSDWLSKNRCKKYK
jgi:hypothetical protein